MELLKKKRNSRKSVFKRKEEKKQRANKRVTKGFSFFFSLVMAYTAKRTERIKI